MSSTGEAETARAAALAAASHVPEQPVAPYLDAVVEYAFRGAARYHVPGHKGGPGADPGVVKAIGLDALAADVPQLIHGIDVGPSPTPYERAEAMAAEAFGAARSWFLTNGATQGNHALCLALAPLGTRVVVQRNSHSSVVDGLVLSGGVPSFVVPEYDEELGITHCVTPESARGGAARERRTPARRSWSRRRTTGWPPTSRGWPRSPTQPGCRSSSTRRGGRTSASTRRCRRRRCPRAPTRC